MHQPVVALRPAATLILVRDGGQGLETLMMQRTHGAAFVPGGYVFPGGALDAADANPFFSTCSGLDETSANRLLNVERGGLAYWVAAVRECFEESGILLAYDKSGTSIRAGEPGSAHDLTLFRKKLAAAEYGFADLCREHELRPALDQLVYFAHWITPLGAPRRFDTRFFIAVAPEGQHSSHDDNETIGHTWFRPSDAVARHRAGELDMMFATVSTLTMLGQFNDTASLIAHARSVPSVPSHRPRVSIGTDGRRVLLDGDPAYVEIGKLDPTGTGKASSEIVPGVATRLSDHVSRIAAPNPSFMTGPGTNSYLIESDGDFAIIDPGPAIEQHVDRLLEHVSGRLRWVLTTHTHMDHSPAAMMIKQRTGATLAGMPPPNTDRQDVAYRPDRILQDGEAITLGQLTLRAVHTPGHASNHLCYLLEQERLLFTGDHIMQGSTVVINPPDGDMQAYLASLSKLKQLDVEYLAPGHGFLMDQPDRVVDRIIEHRMMREHKVVAALRKAQQATLHELLPLAYDDVPEKKHAMAARSLLAHLSKLQSDGRVVMEDDRWRLV